MSVAGTLALTLESRIRELHGGGKTVVQNPLQGPGKKKGLGVFQVPPLITLPPR